MFLKKSLTLEALWKEREKKGFRAGVRMEGVGDIKPQLAIQRSHIL